MARKQAVSLNGFDEMIKALEKAGKDIDAIASDCARRTAEIADANLRDQMRKSGVPNDLINDMPLPKVEHDGNAFYVQVGYEKDRYDPANPSETYKAVFLNYGTPHRSPDRGQLKKKGFVSKAKRKSVKEIKKAEEQALTEMLKEASK